MSVSPISDYQALKALLASKSESFWQELAKRTAQSRQFYDFSFLSTLRRKAIARDFLPSSGNVRKSKLALLGGCTLFPLSELISHALYMQDNHCEIWSGDYDNYVWEMTDESSDLRSFRPDFVFLLPPASRYKYSGKLSDSKESVLDELTKNCASILELCRRAHEGTGAEVILCNFILPSYFDPGEIRTRVMASEWNSLKWLNMEIGLTAPPYVHICDLEFLAARKGGLEARDDKAWFESKQPFSADFAVDVAREVAHIIRSVRNPAKKVLIVDLDETLWGGIIGDDGLNGIELGDTSARGECFKEFQRVIKELSDRGVILSVCSKNDMHNAVAPFEKHPEMVLRKDDFASFQANWDPKPDNILQIASELNLGMDSFVLIDDNPAEIDIVSQFAPAVTGLWLGTDPSDYIRCLRDSRLFETRSITQEDANRASQYKQDENRKGLLLNAESMEAYLESLKMQAHINDFQSVDVPRVAQLINKSNQFNLTTKRRSEAEVASLVDSDYVCYSLRLQDRFGDLGLVSIIIAKKEKTDLIIDTWLMSCRVLKRQVEHLCMNELFSRARSLNCNTVKGFYIPSAKNQMVKDFFPTMGFTQVKTSDEFTEYETRTGEFKEFDTKISVLRGPNDKG
ncbi:MAG: HAD family hydrolase [Candidatus Melainabacteria bacterium]|nr:HAD family hydrolase [Candidatus Melainabacteria bacterium]